jgi:hypothetical protein
VRGSGRSRRDLLLTARQLDRLRELPPGHKLLTASDGSLRSSSDRTAGRRVCNPTALWRKPAALEMLLAPVSER